ncbi:MAG TPA: DUF2809 domain-containing protein, partial [Gillisia sp.]|nr:DUF2809 domain-containing protein [Gillisia sp.]
LKYFPLIFRKNYFILTLILFLVEVIIAAFIQDDFIRPYLGDVLVVILIYTFARTFFKIGTWKAIFLVVSFAFLVEFFQYWKLIEKLDLQDNPVARAVIGTSFSRLDLLCYLVGGVIIAIAEFFNSKQFLTSHYKEV